MIHPLAALRRFLADLAVSVFPRSEMNRFVLRCADRLGFSSFGVNGKLGYFQGSTRDQAVLFSYATTRVWAPEVQGLLDRLLRSGGTFIDVGANIGLTSVPIAKAHQVACYAFEPDPDNYRYLVSNIAANGAETVRPFNLAAMAEEGTLAFERSADNMGDHRVRRGDGTAGAHGEDRREVIRVQGRRLDSVLATETLSAPVVLKVDTQGAEVQVLAGAAGLLKRVDVAILEFWPYGLRRLGDSAQAFYDTISAFPFGAVLNDGPLEWLSTAELITELRRRLPRDGQEEFVEKLATAGVKRAKTAVDHVDVVVSRSKIG